MNALLVICGIGFALGWGREFKGQPQIVFERNGGLRRWTASAVLKTRHCQSILLTPDLMQGPESFRHIHRVVSLC